MRSFANLLAILPFLQGIWVNAYPQHHYQNITKPLPAGVKPKILLTDKPNDPAGKHVKLRYGPFHIPPGVMFQALPEIAGGVKIHKPCDECFLGAFQGGLEYEDGSEANVDTGMYMHHFVVVNEVKPDWLCGLRVGGMTRPQWIYNSGNERPPVRLNTKYKFGMRVDKKDRFSALTEIMNMSNETKTVYTTTIYEVIPINTPGYQEATHLRMDVWMCGGSDVPGKTGAYQYHSPNWTSPYSGVILHNDGHGHDGTTEVNLYINGKVFCNSIQYYGLRPGWVNNKGHGKDMGGMRYISDAITCEDTGRVEKGDVLMTEAFYNDTMYPQMRSKRHIENQMGISFLYIGRDKNTLNDTLKLTAEYDQLPVEMKLASPGAMMTEGISNFLGGLNITAIMAGESKIDLSALSESLANSSFVNPFGLPPSAFNVSNFIPRRASPHVPYGGTPPLPEGLNLTAVINGMPFGAGLIQGGGIAVNELDPFLDGPLGMLTGTANPFAGLGLPGSRFLIKTLYNLWQKR